jgi:predicted enzyme related to lactoylglutathione lyase
MKSVLVPILLAVALSSAPTAARAESDPFLRLGLYVVSADLPRARAFYEKLFEKAPYIENERFLGFEVAGGLYGVFAEGAYEPELARGNNTVPYIRVADIEREFARVAELAPKMLHDAVLEEGPLRLFMFTDTDGNVVEFFSVVVPPSAP